MGVKKAFNILHFLVIFMILGNVYFSEDLLRGFGDSWATKMANHRVMKIIFFPPPLPCPTTPSVQHDLFFKKTRFSIPKSQICPGLNANEIQIPYDKHHKVSSLVKRHQNTHNSVKYEVI